MEEDRITGVSVPLNPELCLLGELHIFGSRIHNAQLKFMKVALCVAKKCIAVSWKSDSPLFYCQVVFEMKSCIPLERNHILSQKTIQHFFENLAAIFRPYRFVS